MIQQNVKYFFCNTHKKKKIISYCQNQECKQSRLLCFDCMKNNIHAQHQQDLEDYEDLETKIESTKNQYDELMLQLNKIMENVQNFYNRVKKGIYDKYYLPIQRIQNLTNDQLIQYINNMIKFNQYQNTIYNQIQQNCQEFEQKIQKCLIELQLDTLTYNVIKNENKEMAEQLFQQNKKDYNGADKLFDQALKYDGNHLNSLFFRGQFLNNKGLYKEAIEFYDKVLIIDSKHLDSLSSKGKCLKHLGYHQEAIAQYDKVLSIDSNHIASLLGKGATLRQQNQLQEALEYIKKAYDKNPNNVSTLEEYGETLRCLNQHNEALTYLEKGLSIQQNNLRLLVIKGDCLFFQKKYNEALDCLKQNNSNKSKYQRYPKEFKQYKNYSQKYVKI